MGAASAEVMVEEMMELVSDPAAMTAAQVTMVSDGLRQVGPYAVQNRQVWENNYFVNKKDMKLIWFYKLYSFQTTQTLCY